MDILLAQSLVYVPSLGGANKSNRLLLEALAWRGHRCEVVAPAADGGTTDTFVQHGVQVWPVRHRGQLRTALRERIHARRPEYVIVSSEDIAQNLLHAALLEDVAVIYLARTTLALPFGPAAAVRSSEGTSGVRRAAGVVAVSRYVQDYLRQWGGVESAVLPISLQEERAIPNLAKFGTGSVMTINPCAYKGLPIVLALADALPDVLFEAVPTWGTRAADRAALASRRNVRLIEPSDNIDDVLSRATVVLVPSLWAEAKARIILEAMLRGLPVMASDVGGNAEALMGVPYLLPVNPIVRYEDAFDEFLLPVPELPAEQPLEVWRSVLRTLLSDRPVYERVSALARDAAHRYLETLTIDPFERFLLTLPSCPHQLSQ
jgi:glycosyltransferase involved in cell wall biosynthesis